MSAVSERSRRRTAGKRMQHLVGKALEEDETFWAHDTWEDSSDGNESFVDEKDEKDEFDSDFNDSESDNEMQEVAAGEEEERKIRREELGRRGHGGSRGRGKTRRIMGEGVNSGLVLSMPMSLVPPSSKIIAPQPELPLKTPSIKVSKPKEKKTTLATTRVRRDKQIRSITKNKKIESKNKVKRKAGSSSQRRFTQEELLLEAVTQTEPENERWLLGRKRAFAEAEATQKLVQKSNNSQLLSRYISKRGSHITITFCDMDAVPAILQPSKELPKSAAPSVCVITGKPARYKDPKTGLEYATLEAFRELRRRFDNKKGKEQLENSDLKRDRKQQPQPSTQEHLLPQSKKPASKRKIKITEEDGGNKKKSLKRGRGPPQQPQKKKKVIERKKGTKKQKQSKKNASVKDTISNLSLSPGEKSSEEVIESQTQQSIDDTGRKSAVRTRNASKLVGDAGVNNRIPVDAISEKSWKDDTSNSKVSKLKEPITASSTPKVENLGNENVSCITLEPSIKSGSIFKEKEDVVIEENIKDQDPTCSEISSLKGISLTKNESTKRPVDVSFKPIPAVKLPYEQKKPNQNEKQECVIPITQTPIKHGNSVIVNEINQKVMKKTNPTQIESSLQSPKKCQVKEIREDLSQQAVDEIPSSKSHITVNHNQTPLHQSTAIKCTTDHRRSNGKSSTKSETTQFHIREANCGVTSNKTSKDKKLSQESTVTRMVSAQTLVNSALAAYIQQQEQAKLLSEKSTKYPNV